MTAACPACEAAQVEGARFCHECGTSLGPSTCGSCGEALVAGAKFCSSCGSSQTKTTTVVEQPEPTHAPLAARRVTSVLFGDLVGFTALSESRDQEDVRELLSRYFEECSKIVGRYGGTVEKFIGDAVMAVWGVPTAHEDDAERAVRAGLELANMVTALGEELREDALSMRVGIVTGEVAVTIGADHQGMVAGDAVNTASRVQAAAEPGQVWVDETTRLLTSSAITYVDVGSHQMKGKSDPVPLWSVRAVVAAMRGAQRADGLEAPLVGRDRELRLFKELFHTAEETGEPRLFVVDGEPGVGKTRLAWEFEKYVDGLSTAVRWHSGRCVAYGEGVAFYALAEAVRGRLGALEGDGADDPGELLEAGLIRYVPDEGEKNWLRPRLGALLGIGSVGTFPREDLFSAWVTFLERVSEDGYPVVLVIDDAQHADDGLLSFVEYLLRVGSFPCFVVLLTRPGLLESHPSLATNRKATIAHLPALFPRDVADLLDGLVAGLPDDIRATLVDRSEGVPLFAVETVRSLIDRDLIIPRGGQYVLADAQGLDLNSIGAPASLQALIAARLDTLSADQRRVIDQASVLGSTFTHDSIAGLCGDIADLDTVLTELVRLQILDQQSSRLSAEFGQYRFVQSAVRQVAYGTLARRDRKAIHLAVVAQLEHEAERTGDLAPVLAQHCLDALEAVPGDPDAAEIKRTAIGYLKQAAERARSLGSPSEAAGHLSSALALADGDVEPAEIECDLALALIDAGSYAEAAPHAVHATAVYDARADDIRAGRAAAAHANALGLMGDNEQALAVAEARWTALDGRREAARTLMDLARVMSACGGALGHDTLAIAEKRIKLAELLGDSGELADALNTLGVSFGYHGAFVLSRVLLEAAADMAKSAHQPAALARALMNLTTMYRSDDLGRALDVGREAVAAARAAGVSVWMSISMLNLLVVLLDRGEWTAIDEILAEGEESADAFLAVASAATATIMELARGEGGDAGQQLDEVSGTDDAAVVAWVGFARALLTRQRGDLAGAVEQMIEAAEQMHALTVTGDDFHVFWPTAADLALEAGDADAVARLLGLVEEDTTAISHGIKVHRRRVEGLLALREDPPIGHEEAQVREVIGELEAWGAMPYVWRTQAALGTWLASHGRADEAQPLLQEARAGFAKIGASAWLAALESQLAAVG